MMLPLAALDRITQFLDGVDGLVASYMLGASPMGEEGLTEVLARALESEQPEHINLYYPLTKLNEELEKLSGVFSVEIDVQNVLFSKAFEHRVTQGDIGFVYELNDRIMPQRSWKYCWIAQAKRLFPVGRKRNNFTENSRFQSFNTAQHARIRAINDAFGPGSIRYLYYAPRLMKLERAVAQKLYVVATDRLNGDIFDFNFGQRLKVTLGDAHSSLFGGMFVGSATHTIDTLRDIYDGLLEHVTPFSWDLPIFIGLEQRRLPGFPDHVVSSAARMRTLGSPVICGVLNGDPDSIETMANVIDKTGPKDPFLPMRTITIRVTVGAGFEGDPIKRHDHS